MSLWHFKEKEKIDNEKEIENMGIDLFVDQFIDTKKQPKKDKNEVKIITYTTTITEATSDIESLRSSSSTNSNSEYKKRHHKKTPRQDSYTSTAHSIKSYSTPRSSFSTRSTSSSIYSASSHSTASTSLSSFFTSEDHYLNETEIDYCYSDDNEDEVRKRHNKMNLDLIHQSLSTSYQPPEGYVNASLINTRLYPLSWRPHFVIFTIGEASCEQRMLEVLFNCKLTKDVQEVSYKWFVDYRRALVTICRLNNNKKDQQYILHLIQRLGISSIMIFIEMKAIETIYKSLDKLFDILAPFTSKKDINAWVQRLFIIFDQYEQNKSIIQNERQHILQRIIPTITKRYQLLLRPSIMFLNISIADYLNPMNKKIPLPQKKIYLLYCKRILWTILTTYPKRWRTLAPYIPDESVLAANQKYSLSITTTNNNNNNDDDDDDDVSFDNDSKLRLMKITTTTTKNNHSNKYSNQKNKGPYSSEDEEGEDDDDDESHGFDFAKVIHKGGYKSAPMVKVKKKLYDNSQLNGRDERIIVMQESDKKTSTPLHHSYSKKPHTPISLTTSPISDKPHTSTSLTASPISDIPHTPPSQSSSPRSTSTSKKLNLTTY